MPQLTRTALAKMGRLTVEHEGTTLELTRVDGKIEFAVWNEAGSLPTILLSPREIETIKAWLDA